MRDLTDEFPTRLWPSGRGIATEGWSPTSRRPVSCRLLRRPAEVGPCLPQQSLALKDLGLDPASKQAPQNDRPHHKRLGLSGSTTGLTFTAKPSPASTAESSPWCVFQGTNGALANQLLGEQLEDGGWNCEHGPSCRRKRPSQPALFVHTTSACSKDWPITNDRAQISGCHEGSQARRN